MPLWAKLVGSGYIGRAQRGVLEFCYQPLLLGRRPSGVVRPASHAAALATAPRLGPRLRVRRREGCGQLVKVFQSMTCLAADGAAPQLIRAGRPCLEARPAYTYWALRVTDGVGEACHSSRQIPPCRRF